MSKRVMKYLAVMLSVLMLISSFPFAGVTTKVSAEGDAPITKKLFKQVYNFSTTDITNNEYAIVVKYQGRYYAVQLVKEDVYGLQGATLPTPANAYLYDNVNTANIRDVTNLIMQKGDDSYLVGCDDSIIWKVRNYVAPGASTDGIGNSLYANTGYVLYSKVDENQTDANRRFLYAGQVDSSYSPAGGTYNFWTLKGQTKRGLTYRENNDLAAGEERTGQFFSCGQGNLDYFLGFKIQDGRAKFGIISKNWVGYSNNKNSSNYYDVRIDNGTYGNGESSVQSDPISRANILLFEATANSESIPLSSYTVHDSTALMEKYEDYKWTYKLGENSYFNGGYQIMYRNSQITTQTDTQLVFFETDKLEASKTYVFASNGYTLKSDLGVKTFESTGAKAKYTASDGEKEIECAVCDGFYTDGSYWTALSKNTNEGKYAFYHKSNQTGTNSALKDVDNAVKLSGKASDTTATVWQYTNGGLRTTDGAYLHFYENGNYSCWCTIEEPSNVKLYQVEIATRKFQPASCMAGDSWVYTFQHEVDGVLYDMTVEYEYSKTRDYNNHFSLVADSTATNAPTCMRVGYEGALLCSRCGTAVGTEKEIAIIPDQNHNIEYVSNGNGTHDYKCTNTSITGTPCTKVIEEGIACTDTNNDCKCDACGATLHHPNLDKSCTEDIYCTVCNAIIERATGHALVYESNGDGSHSRVCTKCEQTVLTESCKDTSTPKNCVCNKCGGSIDHTYISEATCTTPKKCTKCGHVETEALGHNFTGTYKQNYDGTHSRKCANTGCTLYGIGTGATAVVDGYEDCASTDSDCKCDKCSFQLDHDYSGAKATCDEAQECAVCGKELVKAKGHNFTGDYVQNNDGTHSRKCVNDCGETGAVISGVQTKGGKVTCEKTTNHCKCVCGREMSHSPNLTEATCLMAKVCMNCGDELQAQKSHDYSDTKNYRKNGDGTHCLGCVNGCSGHGEPVDCEDAAGDGNCNCDVCSMFVKHTNGDAATCTTPQVCTECSAVIVAAKGHKYTNKYECDNNGHHQRVCDVCLVAEATVLDCVDVDKDCTCDDCGKEIPSAHNYKVTAATCMEGKICTKCGKTAEAKKDHDFDTANAIPSGIKVHVYPCKNSCGTYGNETACVDVSPKDCTCDICGYFFGHEAGTAPSCTSAQTCKNCGTELTEASGHDFTGKGEFLGINEQTGKGTHRVKCKNCDVYQEVAECIKSTIDCTCNVCEHQFDHIGGPEATCTTTQNCTYCGTKMADKKSHDFSGAVQSNENGTHSFLCKNGCGYYGGMTKCTRDTENGCLCTESDCGYQFKHVEVKVAAVKATCTTDGSTEGTKCSECNTVIKAVETIEKTNHKNKYFKEGTEETCEGYYCPDCTKWIVGESLVDNPEHSIVTDEYKKPTCVTLGKTEGSHCEICGYVKVAQEDIPSSGHDFEETVIEPTCTDRGYTFYKCKLCPYSYLGNFTKAGHKDEDNNGYCDVCGAELTAHVDPTKDCECICHSTDGFSRFTYKMLLTFWKLFGINKTCDCGISHY